MCLRFLNLELFNIFQGPADFQVILRGIQVDMGSSTYKSHKTGRDIEKYMNEWMASILQLKKRSHTVCHP